MKIHLATDHAGLELKNSIKAYLIENNHDVEDHGAHEYDAQDDYPDFIFPALEAVALDSESKRNYTWRLWTRRSDGSK